MTTGKNEQILYNRHPSMFRNNLLRFFFWLALIILGGWILFWGPKNWPWFIGWSFIGVGMVTLFFWWIKEMTTSLMVTDKRIILRKGILSKYTNEIFHSNVKNVEVRQTFSQRIFGIGYIGISSAGQSGYEIQIDGIRDPDQVKQIIYEHVE